MSDPAHPAPGSSDQAVADVIAEITDRLQAGESVDVEAYAARCPEAAERIRRLVPALQAMEALQPAPGEDHGNTLTGTLGDYRILREVGRGGMGVVYEVDQISLGRRVALKVLPFAATMDPRHLQRFQNEARAAASLHHEHIVPVHGVGCERGIHYYAMQFIDGLTLAELIEAQRSSGSQGSGTVPPVSHPTAADTVPAARASTQRPPEDAAAFRRVAEWGAAAAEALEHAHSLGIVHRDIKPGNLMIDGRGKLWVTDFGLARTAADSDLTVSGDILGTLRYMSPEQALAKHGLVDHRTDIYALAGTLYELLTLQPTVQGRDRGEILDRITREEPAAPRALNRAVPSDLEIIILKGLAKEPGDRYATAREMAEDLRRFLQGGPILARRPTFQQRLIRWAHQRRHLILSVAVGGLLTTILLAISVAIIWRENNRTRAALAKAQVRTRVARDAVNDMYSEVAEKWLDDAAHMTAVQHRFLKKALDFYEDLVKEQSDDPDVRLQTAAAYRRMAMLSVVLDGGSAKSDRYLRQAETLARELADEFPDRVAFREEQFRSTHALAFALWSRAQFDEAEGPLRKAASLASDLAVKFPDQPAYLAQLARCHHTLAELLYRTNPVEAEREYLEAARIQRGLVALFPDASGYLGNLAETHADRIGFLAASGRLETVDACCRELGELEGIMDLGVRHPECLANLTSIHSLKACLLMDLGRLLEAKEALDRVLRHRKERWERQPERLDYQHGCAMTQWKRGRLFVLRGRLLEAQQAYQQAVDHQTVVYKTNPQHPSRRHELALMLGELGWYHLLVSGQRENAVKGLAAVEEALKIAPDGGVYLRALLGLAYYRTEQVDRAMTTLEEARTTLANPNPPKGWTTADDTYLVQSAGRKEKAARGLILYLLAMTHHRRGDRQKAADLHRQAHEERARDQVPPQEAKALAAIEAEARTVLGR